MKASSLAIALFLGLLAQQSSAQFQGRVFEENAAVKVTRGTVDKKLAWSGGLNNPQYAIADLNKDGLKDLVIFQADQFSVKTFINRGTVSAPDYRYEPQFAKNFPQCFNYLILKDYNGDGIEDLFEAGGVGFTAHRGYYNGSNELCFSLYKGLFYNNDRASAGWVNAEVNPGDIPAIVDVDNDGDLDFLSYYGDGFFMNWYRNYQVENALPKDSISIRLVDRCWGKMRQGALRTHDLGITCDNSALLRVGAGSHLKRTDGGNTPCLLDMDGDGDYDVLDGHRAFNYVVYLQNGKDLTGLRDSMIFQDTTYTTLGDTVKIAQWAAPFFIDVDLDGKRDLMLAPNTPLTSENYYCSKFYKNIGTDKVPSFQYQGDTFLVEHMIDVGSNAYPFFYDYNRDGKPDLFVGNRGYYDRATGQFLSRVMYLQNTSTPGNPSFDIITDDFLGLSARAYRGISLSIGDLDNDGKDDLVIGHLDGELHFIKNTAATTTAIPVWTSTPVLLRDASSNIIATNSYAAPLVYDMDADGVKDLLIGDQLGSLYYYQNNSSGAGSYSLNLVTTELGFVKTDPEKFSSGHSTPFIGKIDNSPREYLLMGSRSGRIFRYTGFEGGNVFSAYKRLDSAYSFIFSDYASSTFYFSAPAVADIDNDGFYDMVVGNIYGGLLLYKQAKTVSTQEQNLVRADIELFPNPANAEIFLRLGQTKMQQNASVLVYNNLGQLVQSYGQVDLSRIFRFNIEGLAAGVYNCVVRIDNEQYTRIFVKRD